MHINNGFRVFTGRLIFGWIFSVMIITLVLGALPYQLETGPDALIPWLWFKQVMSVLASTLVLIAFFLPNRVWSIFCFIALILFNFCYHGISGNAFYHFAWFGIVAPFCLSDQHFLVQLRASKVFMAIFLFFNAVTMRAFNPLALPAYTLFLIPYLPWHRLYNWFEAQFEPK